MKNKIIHDLKIGDYVTAKEDCIGSNGKCLTKNNKYKIITKDFSEMSKIFIIDVIDDLGVRHGFTEEYFSEFINDDNSKTRVENKTIHNLKVGNYVTAIKEYVSGKKIRLTLNNKYKVTNIREYKAPNENKVAISVIDNYKEHFMFPEDYFFNSNKTIQDLKVGDYVIAIKYDANLTLNKEYKIIDIYYNGVEWENFKIKNDFGFEETFSIDYFEIKKTGIENKTIEMSHSAFSSFKKVEKTGVENKTSSESKPHLCCFDPHLEYEMGMGMRAGANKHGWNNHRNLTSDSAQQILDSLKRHLNAFLRGEEKDKETNTSHLACVGNNLNFLYRMTKQDGYEKVLENIYGEKND